MDLLIASKNLHKVRELRSLFKSFSQIDIYSLNDFPDFIPPAEVGETFQENAILKAQAASKYTHFLTLSDDSGLMVPALNGKPGVHSRYYAGPEATDKENRIKLLKEMQGLTDLQRAAYFECVLCLAKDDFVKCVSGTVHGEIVTEERGRQGHGYDSVFLKHDYGKTFGELDESLKNQISHRAKAFEKLKLVLEGYLSSNFS